jgi:hypothetical protein
LRYANGQRLEELWPTALPTDVEIEDRLLQIAAASPDRQAGLERFAKGRRA